jgi:hypothetical protein
VDADICAEIGKTHALKTYNWAVLFCTIGRYTHRSDSVTPMAQALREPKRYRGFVLTSNGRKKLRDCIRFLELRTGIHQGARAIAERVQLLEPEGIHPMTVRKILRGQQGVDKRSIHHVFEALQLSLEVGDYAHTSLYSEGASGNQNTSILKMI